jgi:hypothetical protein
MHRLKSALIKYHVVGFNSKSIVKCIPFVVGLLQK